MYGLTEAFRSTYLDPAEVDRRPDSIGKAIPNAEILVVRPDGTPCDANEPGELVHRGVQMALGCWNSQSRSTPVPAASDGCEGIANIEDAEVIIRILAHRDRAAVTPEPEVAPLVARRARLRLQCGGPD